MGGYIVFNQDKMLEREEYSEGARITVPPPRKIEDVIKGSIFARCFKPFMMLMTLMMVIMMVKSGRRQFNPQMITQMMNMVMGALMVVGVGGGESAKGGKEEVNHERNEYFFQLAEHRKTAHSTGKQLHSYLTTIFPNPHLLTRKIGDDHMWNTDARNRGGYASQAEIAASYAAKPKL